MWDCNTDKYSTFVYDSDGALLGSGTNIDFRNPSTSIRRFTAGCGKRAFTTPFSMWLDDLEVYDFSPATNRYAVTRTISLPPGKEWSVLSIDKEEKGLSMISTSILDINNDPIHGISYNPHASAIDLTTLNELGVTSIKLKFNFTLVDFEIPVLKGYGIEWSDSNAFYDTFLTELFIGEKTHVVVDEGNVALEGEKELGKVVSEIIEKPEEAYWSYLKIGKENDAPSSILVSVLDAITGEHVEGFDFLEGEIIDLSNLDPTIHSRIKLEAIFQKWGSESPTLNEWSVCWISNTDTQIISLNMPERIYRGSSYRMGIEISESEQELSTLDVNLEARLEGTTDWTTDILGSPFFNSSSGGWECLLQPGLDSDVGNYSLKVTVIDNFGNSFEHVFPTQVTVLNNIPAPPVIEIRPRAPKTGDNLRAVMVQEGSDIETDTLVYSYRWFINGEPLSLYDSDSVQPFTDRMIDSVETAKGDMVSLMVYSFDGLNISDPFRVSVLIGNTPPIIQPDFPGNVSLMEDQENDTVRVQSHLLGNFS